MDNSRWPLPSFPGRRASRGRCPRGAWAPGTGGSTAVSVRKAKPAMIHHGFLRVAAATPLVRVADCAYNAGQVVALLRQAEAEGVAVVVFPELCLTGYTCA